MANYNPGTGKWNTSSGTGEFDSRQEAEQWESVHGSGSSGGNSAAGIFDLIWGLFRLIPKFIGLLIGAFVSVLMRFGVAGKVMLTLLATFGTFLLLTIFASAFVDTENIFVSIALILLSALVGFWFWVKHYKALKQMPNSQFIKHATTSVMIVFWGTILLYILYGILLSSVKITPAHLYLSWAAFIIPFAVAAFYWVRKVNSYKSIATDSMVQPEVAKVAKVEKFEKFEKFEKKPPVTAPASTGARYAKGDHIWARWSGDGNLYFAVIENVSNNSLRVTYYDNVVEEVSKNNVFSLEEALNSGLRLHGNWQDGGSFYPCIILKQKSNTVRVKYTQDNVEEELPYQGLVFIK